METRKIQKIYNSKPVTEGAGVRLKRAIGFDAKLAFDPFLLLDDFRSDNPADYLKGFPWHPHRGIETITYVLRGNIEHGDSMKNRGVISSGDVQWMTAGSSTVNGTQGPVRDIITDPEYLDITVPASSGYVHPVKRGYTVFAYVIDGHCVFCRQEKQRAANETLVFFGDGDSIQVSTDDAPARFLLVSEKPIREPVAWSGPIVMNTEKELRISFEEYGNGTFIKHG